MTRYKGQITSRQIDRDYPHQVEIAVPPGGLSTQRDIMHDFCRGRTFMTRGAKQRVNDAVRWCFDHRSDADAFHAQLGGVRSAIENRKPRDPSDWRE